MREFVVRVLLSMRQLLNPCLGPMVVGTNADLEAERTALQEPVTEPLSVPDSTDDESSAARLSRRSSVLIDLISLFRRSSSSTGRTVRFPGQIAADQNGDDELDPEETKTMSKERVLEAIRQKKEVITKLRSQPWSMKRKLRTLKVARRYLQRQKQKVSKWHLWKVESMRRLTQFGRWCDNMKIYLIPWEAKIKGIESHYGSVVSSYFTFLRWVLSVNITMTVIMMLFVTIPEWLADSRADPIRYNKTYHIKVMKPKEIEKADELNTVLDFKGYFEYSLLFYGYYSSETYFGDTVQYSVPVAYFTVNLFILGYSFFVILRKMASNARNSKLSGGKTEQYVFNWKLFTGWDYTIGNPETATNVVMANVNKFREVIAEYNVNMKKKFDCLQLSLRIFANILVFLLQAGSVWAILEVSQITTKTTFVERNAVSITVSFITLTFPNFYDLISKIERYHPRTALRLQLGRVLFLYIINYYTLIVSLMFMLNTMESQRSGDQQLLIASHFSDEALFPTFSPLIPVSRTGRQVTFQVPAGLSPFNDTVFNTTTTTPAPTSPWTTVLPKFGPFAVANPNVVVSAVSKNLPNSSTFYMRPIGRADWNKNVSSVATPLNYSTSVRAITAERLTTDWYEECWENLIGQEITKLVTMDLAMTIASILVIDFLRGLWVRYCNLWWFWNLECTFPEYGEFKVAENVLHLVNNQGMIWLGLFFVPMLPAINNIKLIILMYVRAWAVMTCNVPARQIFRASRSSNFYLMLLLLMLFLCTLPVGYVIASKKPSKICGPFGSQETFYSVITQLLDKNLSRGLVKAIKYMVSPGIVIPVLLLLLLMIYFLFALVRGLREANTDLSNQLMHERTEEKKKIFELAGGGKKRNESHAALNHAKANRKERIAKNGSSNSDEERSPTHSQRSKDLHSFVPSLNSVSEEARVDLDEEKPQQEHDKTPSLKLNWKQRLMLCIGLTDIDRIRARRPLEGHDNHAEEEDESPISGKKSTEQATSEDQRSYSSISESYSSECHSDERSYSQSFYDCASTANNEPSDGTDGSNHRHSPAKRSGEFQCSANQNDASKSASHSDDRSRTREDNASPSSYFTGRENSSSSSPTRSLHKNGTNTLQVPEEHRKRHSASPRPGNGKSPKHSHSHSHKSSNEPSSSRQHSPHTAPQSLLEPLRSDSERWMRQLQQSDGTMYLDRTEPPVDEISFQETTPQHSRQPSATSRSQYSDESERASIGSRILPAISTKPEYLGLSDPRIVYSDPYSSYANAMMSPILEMQPIRPVPSESDAEDDVERSTEKTHLIHTHRSRSKDRERKHSKGNGHTETPSTSHSHTDTMVRPPRFRISLSPKRYTGKELHEKDASPRQYVMRVQPTEESAQPQRNEQRGGPPIVYSRLPDLEGQPRNNVSSRGRGVERMTHRSSNSTCVPRSDVAQRSRHKNTYV